MNRKNFLRTLGTTGLLFPAFPLLSFAKPQEGPKLDKELVQKFVGASHRNLDTVKELLEEHPTLLNAAHDWGYGDFETGLGAASHVGNKEVANYLLERGAQYNIFTATLFGHLEIVKALISGSPHLKNAKGPHGFTLLHHANVGGKEATEVKDYLLSLGLKETKIPLY